MLCSESSDTNNTYLAVTSEANFYLPIARKSYPIILKNLPIITIDC